MLDLYSFISKIDKTHTENGSLCVVKDRCKKTNDKDSPALSQITKNAGDNQG